MTLCTLSRTCMLYFFFGYSTLYIWRNLWVFSYAHIYVSSKKMAVECKVISKANQMQLHATSLHDKKWKNESENRPPCHETGCSIKNQQLSITMGTWFSSWPDSAPFELDLHQHHRRMALHLKDCPKKRWIQNARETLVPVKGCKRWAWWHFWSPNWQRKMPLIYHYYSPCLLAVYTTYPLIN